MSTTIGTHPDPGASGSRPRIEGDRERQILDAALDVLADVGYDRLTMDAVAASARASKATLYRRWSSKAELVIEALCSTKDEHEAPDTGTLRGDLLGTFCQMGADDTAPASRQTITILASVMTAVARDRDFAEIFRRDFLEPKAHLTDALFQRAKDRGEISADLELDLIAPALPGIVMHQAFVMGKLPDAAFITRVVDQIILPAVGVTHLAGISSTQTTQTTQTTSSKDS